MTFDRRHVYPALRGHNRAPELLVATTASKDSIPRRTGRRLAPAAILETINRLMRKRRAYRVMWAATVLIPRNLPSTVLAVLVNILLQTMTSAVSALPATLRPVL